MKKVELLTNKALEAIVDSIIAIRANIESSVVNSEVETNAAAMLTLTEAFTKIVVLKVNCAAGGIEL